MYDTVESNVHFCPQKPSSTLSKNTYEVALTCPSIAPWVEAHISVLFQTSEGAIRPNGGAPGRSSTYSQVEV